MDPTETTTRKKLHEKEFVVRNSLLTDLFENKHIRTVYNIFIAIFVGLFVNTAVYGYVTKNEITLGLRLVKVGFAKIHIVALIWSAYFIFTCLIFFILKIWANNRNFRKLRYTKIWDCFWIISLGTYYLLSFKIAGDVITFFELPIASSIIVAAESVRFLMKVHSFIRTNAPKVSHEYQSEKKLELPQFSNFLYFLFIPTLLYRDSYPRTETINWSFALFRFIEFAFCIYFFSLVTDTLLNPPLQELGLRKFTSKEIIVRVFENSLTGILMLLTFFFVLLHSTQNFFAEITRFGDRMFYSDWWTCTNYGCFFLKWNIVVQDWLYAYVYKDVYENLGNNGIFAKYAVFVISAVVHEWAFTYSFGFFLPLVLFEFLVFGPFLTYFTKSEGVLLNVWMWYSISLGMGTLVTGYTMEYYARNNAFLAETSSNYSWFPRFLTCNCIEYN